MLTEKQLERYAEVLIWGLKTARTGRFKKDDIILVRYHLPAVRLAEILNRRLLGMGMNPVFRMSQTPTMEKDFFQLSHSKQLTFIAPGVRRLYQHINGSIFLHAPESITHLSDVDPKKIGKTAVARKPLRDILDKRDEKGLFGWTLCTFPTEELAHHAKMPIEDYARQIVKACFLNKTAPVSHWQEIFKKAKSVKNWLNRMPVKYFHIESKNVDLKITPGEKRRWIGISGHNIPSFELFLSPDWRGTEGFYFADQPSFRSGNYVKGVRLVFKKGSVSKVEAASGVVFARKQMSMDEGAGRLGEFSLTDKRFSKIDKFMANTLFDENYGGAFGNCHIAVGSAYSDTYSGDPARLTKAMKKKLGFNDSALHWDLVNTEKKRVTAHLKNGKRKTIYENGIFTL
jgi:aminopeptidase